MNRGSNSPIQGYSPSRTTVMAAALGGGAASNGTLPANGQLTDASGKYPKGENFASTLVYDAATGKYYMTLLDWAKHVLWFAGIVLDSGGAPTAALYVLPTKVDVTNKRLYFNVYTPAGALTDLGTSDMVILMVDVADTTAIG